MEITYTSTLVSLLKNKHLLLDTNVFLDALAQQNLFVKFFNMLKEHDVALGTTDFVQFELLKGSASDTKYLDKEKYIKDIIDAIVPTTPKVIELAYDLIKEYQLDGTGVSITDLLLGAQLKLYKGNIFLLSRDTSAFVQRIFHLEAIVNCPHKKGIFAYGVYGC